jgi:hypothetical protein
LVALTIWIKTEFGALNAATQRGEECKPYTAAAAMTGVNWQRSGAATAPSRRWGWQSKHQLMTASMCNQSDTTPGLMTANMVHVTNLTPPGSGVDNPSRARGRRQHQLTSASTVNVTSLTPRECHPYSVTPPGSGSDNPSRARGRRHQLMTGSMVHGTNLTPPGVPPPTRRMSASSPASSSCASNTRWGWFTS